jgi:uncharacterized protein YgbK (DUF1537 family)
MDEKDKLEVPPRKRGRPKGSHNKTSKAQVEKFLAEGNVSPLDYLSSIYQDPLVDQKLRVEAARAAAPYVHSRLSTTEVKAALTELSHEQWLKSLK